MSDFPDIVKRKFQSEVSSVDIRVMQWNILADGYSHSSPTENFCAVPPDCLSWHFRYVQIMKHIDQLDADVVCLEEVDHFDQINTHLSKQGYEGDFMLRRDVEVHHGVALFFKPSKFELVESVREYLLEENGVVGNQGLLIKVLNNRNTNRKVIVGVTHLKAKRPFFKRRHAQTNAALGIFKTISSKYEGVPVIWAGDFNGETSEAFHKAISESPLKLSSSYADLLGSEPEFTTWKIRPTYEERHTIDYLWYTKESLSLQNVLLPMENEDVPESRHPSHDHPSDHISICADFKFV